MEWTPFSAWSWIASGVTLVFIALAWRTLRAPEGAPLGRRLAWLALRAAVLAVLLVILLDPHKVQRREFREPRDVAVLIDDSASMALRDDPGGPTRVEQLRKEAPALAKLAEGGVRMRWYRFASDASPANGPDDITARGSESRIAKALETVLGDERDRELGAVVLVSDGQTLDPEAARRAARLYEQAGVPLHTRALGTPSESPDIRLSGVVASQSSLYEPRLRITGTLTAPGFTGRKVTLQVRCEGRVIHESNLTPTAENQPLDLIVDTPFKGFHRYEVEILPSEGERLADNNGAVFGADVQDRKIRVLYMEGTRNATHFLENALELDPDIEVTSLFFPQGKDFEAARALPFAIDEDGRKIYNVAHPYKGFPTTLEKMLTYDVVINSDIYKEAFSPEQLQFTVDLVEKYGGGFVMVGGNTAFGAGHYDETVIDKLMPVDVTGNEGIGGGTQLQVPEPMYDHPVMALGANREETIDIWTKRFPGFGAHNSVNRAKPGARVLAFNARRSNKYGPLVLFAVQQIGQGRTMAFTSDTTAAWGRKFHTLFGTESDPTLYYRRFWNQTIRWLAAERIRRKSGELLVEVDRNTAVPGEEVSVSIPFPPGSPDAPVTLNRTVSGGEPLPVELVRDEVSRKWLAHVPVDGTGEWLLTARMARAEMDPLFARVLVNAVPDTRESQSTAANHKLMAELAKIGRGRPLGDDPGTWSVAVDENGSRIIEYSRNSVWDRWWVMAVLLALLTLEWGLRRGWIAGAALAGNSRPDEQTSPS